jgi:alpha-N-acetylglucosaminidase
MAVSYFLNCFNQLGQSELYRNDAIILASMYLGIRADHYYKEELLAQATDHKAQKQTAEDKLVQLLTFIDQLLTSHPECNLSKWIGNARSWGATPKEKNYYEEDAKRLITTWGGNIDDYATKMWSGLIREYYLPRVKLIISGKKDRLRAWEETWIEKPGPISKINPYSHPIAKAKRLVDKFSD